MNSRNIYVPTETVGRTRKLRFPGGGLRKGNDRSSPPDESPTHRSLACESAHFVLFDTLVLALHRIGDAMNAFVPNPGGAAALQIADDPLGTKTTIANPSTGWFPEALLGALPVHTPVTRVC